VITWRYRYGLARLLTGLLKSLQGSGTHIQHEGYTLKMMVMMRVVLFAMTGPNRAFEEELVEEVVLPSGTG